MAEQLQQMAGPGAVLRVNGFSGGRLPPKSQIAEIRFRFDPYSAENHEAGFPRVDIRTRPGNGQWRNNASLTFRDESLNARNAFAADEAVRAGAPLPVLDGRPDQEGQDVVLVQHRRHGLVRHRDHPAPATPTARMFNGVVSPTTDRVNFNARVEHAINKNQMLRVEFSRNANEQNQLGVGGFELSIAPTIARPAATSSASRRAARCSARCATRCASRSTGTRRCRRRSATTVTLRVQDAFTSGGAQIAGGRRSKTIEFADNLDFALGKKHALRAGILVEGGSYRSDETRNFNGTYTFSVDRTRSCAGQAQQFSQRVGDPLVEYKSFQFGAYLQDDFRVQKNLMVSYGIRYEAQTHLGDNVNLSPRVSFAWTPFKSGSTTVRGGFGVFNDWYEDSLYEQALRLDGVRQRDVIVRNPTYPSADVTSVHRAAAVGHADRGRPGDAADHARVVRRRARLRQLGAVPQQLLRPAHVGRVPRRQPQCAGSTACVPFPDLGIITYVDAIGEAKSQGIDLSMNLNYAPKRIFGTINYRLAKAMNDGDSATSLPMNGGDLAAEWGPSRGDVRHRIFGFASVPLKYGLRSNLNMRYESGTPYNITTGFDDNDDNVLNDRPAGVGRNSARGDGQLNVDLRLSWQKSIGQPKGGDQGPGGPGGGPVIVRGPGRPGSGRRRSRPRRRGWRRRLWRRLRAGRQRRPGQLRGVRPGVEPDQHGELPQLLGRARRRVLRPGAVLGRAAPYRARHARRLLGSDRLRSRLPMRFRRRLRRHGCRSRDWNCTTTAFERGPGIEPRHPALFCGTCRRPGRLPIMRPARLPPEGAWS